MKWVIKKVLGILVSLIVLMYGLIFVLSRFGFEPITVTSHNICKGLSKGDLCFAYEKETYKKGDVVVLLDVNSYNFESVISSNEEGTYNITGGVKVVDNSKILGKVMFAIPLAGYLIFFLTTVNSMDWVLVLLVVVILLCIVKIIFKIINRSITKSINNSNTENNTVVEPPELKHAGTGIIYNSVQEFWNLNYKPDSLNTFTYDMKVDLAHDTIYRIADNHDISAWLDKQHTWFVKQLGASFLCDRNAPEDEIMEFWKRVLEKQGEFNNMN